MNKADNDNDNDNDNRSTPLSYDKTKMEAKEISIPGGASKSILLNASSSSKDALLGIRLVKGKSLLSVSNLLSPEEIEYVRQASIKAAARQTLHNTHPEEQGPDRLCVRMPTQLAASRHDIPDAGSQDLHDPLPLDLSHYVEERILQRTLRTIDEEFPDVRETLFGGDCKSLVDLFVNDQLEWSTREPAINVYYPPAGYFGIHKDNKALTILMPLTSSCEDDSDTTGMDLDSTFTGGGTAFWSQSYPNEHRHAPSIVLKPNAGTALLWGGQLSHKGLPIDKGMRVVFVASFSRKANPNQKANNNTWVVSAR